MLEQERNTAQFFPEVVFHFPDETFSPKKYATTVEESHLQKALSQRIERIFYKGYEIMPFVGWREREILIEFEQTLRRVSANLGANLSIEGRAIDFVTCASLQPQTEEEKINWKEDCGEKYALHLMEDGILADTLRIADGSFEIRLGFKGEESATTKEFVLATAGHEFGHTLGEDIADPLYEEMKAFAFQSLFMKHYAPEFYSADVKSIEGMHHIAKRRVEQLLWDGVSEGAIISHLIGEPFGIHRPYDYRQQLRQV